MFLSIVFPVFAVIAVGFASQRVLNVDAEPMTRLGLYVLTPALVFVGLVNSTVTVEEFLLILLFVVFFIPSIILLTVVLSRVLGLDRSTESALLLNATFMNSGNYGLPVVLFALGPEGFERAILLVVLYNAFTYTLGVYLATRAHLSFTGSVKKILSMPSVYAIMLALSMRYFGVDLPDFLYRPVDLLAQAAIPVILLNLGMQLSLVRPNREVPVVVTGLLLRLVFSPVVAYGLVRALGITGVAAPMLIIEAAMPTAVTVTLLSMEFDCRPQLVSTVTFATTLASPLTVSAVLYALQGMHF